MKRLLILLCAMTLAFCLVGNVLEAQPPPPPPPALNFLEGTVMFVGLDCGPGLAAKAPPCSGPYPDYEIIVYEADGVTIETQCNSDENGNYKIVLDPGDYIIYTKSGPFREKTNEATILTGETTRLDLAIDTGKR